MKTLLASLFAALIGIFVLSASTSSTVEATPPFSGNCFSNCMDHAENCGQGPTQCGGTPTQIIYCICALGENGAEWNGCTASINYAATNCHMCCGDLM